MKCLGKYLLFAVLVASAGCLSNSADKRPAPAKTSAKTEPAEDQAPADVVKVVPPDQLNQLNANDQADALFRELVKDKRELGPSDTASTGTNQDRYK
jgi:hypothetical protein